MPEGHSVHRLARQFTDVFAGRRLAVSSPQGRFAAGAALLDGRVLLGGEAHGKQLFLNFEGGLVLRVHLGLYGAWDFGGDETFRGASSIGAPRRVGEREVADDGVLPPGAARDGAGPPSSVGAAPPAPVGAVRVRLVSEHGWADLRGASVCAAETEAEADAVRARLGPDPLHAGARTAAGEEFARLITRRRTPVGLLLMDQAVVAGIGNVYRAELLFRAGLDPSLPGTSLGAERARALWLDACDALEQGVRDGRIITTDPALWPAPGELPPPDHAHYVYRRQGLACRQCGTGIALASAAGRKLYWCPACQA